MLFQWVNSSRIKDVVWVSNVHRRSPSSGSGSNVHSSALCSTAVSFLGLFFFFFFFSSSNPQSCDCNVKPLNRKTPTDGRPSPPPTNAAFARRSGTSCCCEPREDGRVPGDKTPSHGGDAPRITAEKQVRPPVANTPRRSVCVIRRLVCAFLSLTVTVTVEVKGNAFVTIPRASLPLPPSLCVCVCVCMCVCVRAPPSVFSR